MIPRPAKTANESLAVAWHNYPVQTPKTSYTIITMTTAQALKKIEKLERELAAVKAEVLGDVPYDEELTDEFKLELEEARKSPIVGKYTGPGSLIAQAATYANS
jgi:hypothetical protein